MVMDSADAVSIIELLKVFLHFLTKIGDGLTARYMLYRKIALDFVIRLDVHRA